MAEVTKVGVQGLTPGDHEEHGAQHHEAPMQIFGEEAHGVVRRDRRQHPRLAENLAQSEHADGSEPDEHHRAEHRSEEHTSELQSLAYLVCRLLLEKKKKNR